MERMTELAAMEHVANRTERQGTYGFPHGHHGTVDRLGVLHPLKRIKTPTQQAGHERGRAVGR